MRAIDREFGKIRKLWQTSGIFFTGNIKQAKSLVVRIADAKNADARKPLYRKPLKMARKVMRRLAESLKKLEYDHPRSKSHLAASIERLQNVSALFPQGTYQAEQRVLKGKNLPPENKVVSIFATHSDII